MPLLEIGGFDSLFLGSPPVRAGGLEGAGLLLQPAASPARSTPAIHRRTVFIDTLSDGGEEEPAGAPRRRPAPGRVSCPAATCRSAAPRACQPSGCRSRTGR